MIKNKIINLFLAVNESLHGPSPCGRSDSFFVSYAYLLNKNTPLCLFMETVLMSSHAMYYFYYGSVECSIWSSL